MTFVNADQIGHKGPSHIAPSHLDDPQVKSRSFWQVCPIISDLNVTQHLKKKKEHKIYEYRNSSAIVWACFVAPRHGQLAVFEGDTHLSLKQFMTFSSRSLWVMHLNRASMVEKPPIWQN